MKARIKHAFDRETLFLGRVTMIFVLVAILWPAVATVNQMRWWRDLSGQTPFRDVVVTKVTATDIYLSVSGTLVKARDCLTVGDPIVSVVKGGLAYPAAFHADEPESTALSRPVMDQPQRFGIWRIQSHIAWPDRAQMYRTHNCDGTIMTNQVFDIPWKSKGGSK